MFTIGTPQLLYPLLLLWKTNTSLICTHSVKCVGILNGSLALGKLWHEKAVMEVSILWLAREVAKRIWTECVATKFVLLTLKSQTLPTEISFLPQWERLGGDVSIKILMLCMNFHHKPVFMSVNPMLKHHVSNYPSCNHHRHMAGNPKKSNHQGQSYSYEGS